ncbi:MAG: hypothetical protein ACRDH6_03765 [Actinomycetota bacterium]
MKRRVVVIIVATGVAAAGASAVAFLRDDSGSVLTVPGSEAPEGGTTRQSQPGALVDFPTFVKSSTRFEPETIAKLIVDLAARADGALTYGRFPPTEERFLDVFDPLRLSEGAREAVRCARASASEETLAPFHIEIANFETHRAYVVAFLRAPDAVSLFDRLVIWAVDRSGCTPLHVAFQRL